MRIVAATNCGVPHSSPRMDRIRSLHSELQRDAANLLLTAYRLGLELIAERDETLYGQWLKRFGTDLAFIRWRRAYRCIKLATTFQSEAQIVRLPEEEASSWSRSILGGHFEDEQAERDKKPPTPVIDKCGGFCKYLARKLKNKAAKATSDECDLFIEALVSLRTEAETGLAEFEKRKQALDLRLVGRHVDRN